MLEQLQSHFSLTGDTPEKPQACKILKSIKYNHSKKNKLNKATFKAMELIKMITEQEHRSCWPRLEENSPNP